jgi:uncharacterized protein
MCSSEAEERMSILIFGGSGLVGTALATALRADGKDAIVLRAPRVGDPNWDPAAGAKEVAAMEGAEAVVHLGGASIGGGRWTPERKKVLRGSRVDSTRLLVDAMTLLREKPKVFVCASAVGYYGSRGDETLTESSAAGNDFLGTVTEDWEAQATRAAEKGIRTVMTRFGVVLSAKGGALPKMLTPFKLGAGGRLGDGKQWMAWVAIDDVVGAIRWAIANPEARGPVNVVAPNPVENREFTRVLARVLDRPAIFPAPAFALRLMLGEMADALLLSSQRAKPEKLLAAGYKFQFENLEPALRHTLYASA